MASKIACADGNFNTAGTWGVVDATSMLDSEAGNTEIGTSYTSSSTFTPGGITVDGVAVKLAANGTGAYTVSLQLYNSTDSAAVAGTEVTINRADLCTATTTTNAGGWVFFKFESPVTLEAAHDYTVQLKESNAAANVYFYRDGTANNWSRMLRTTTTGAPADTDILHIMEEKTGAGAATARTVTMDQISSSVVDLGSGTDATAALTISDGGTLQYGYTAATNYYLKCSGNLIVYSGGILTIGTTTNPIPRDGTAVLEFDPAADGGMGLIIRDGATFTAQGLSRSSGKNIVSCLLNTDEATNSTSLGVDTDTGWLDNDQIAVASTTPTYTQGEKGTLNGDAGASSLTVDGFAGTGGGLAYAHSGTAPTQAEVILLTRNVKIRSASSTIMSYVYFQGTSTTIDIDWVEFYYLGENVAGKRGVEVTSTTGTQNIAYSSFHDIEDWGLYVTGYATITYCVSYLLNSNSGTGLYGVYLYNASLVFTYNIIMRCETGIANNDGSVYVYLTSCTFDNNSIVSGDYNGLLIRGSSSGDTMSWSNITIHSCSRAGVSGAGATGTVNGSITGLTIWRCGSSGFTLQGSSSSSTYQWAANVTVTDLTAFGNNGSNIYFYGGANGSGVVLTLINPVLNGDSSFSTTTGITISSQNAHSAIVIFVNGGKFSEVTGIKTALTNDINFTNIKFNSIAQIYLNNVLFGGTNEVGNYSLLSTSNRLVNFVKSTKHNQTASNHKSWFKYGIISSDSTVNMYRTASPSERLTPNNASNKLESGSFKVNVNSGQTCTPIVYVRESVAGDGTDYNGNRPRLILKRNDAIGVTADAVIDTATVSAEGAFEQLTGTTAAVTDDGVMEFVIDCDGTTGWVNVDDFSATVA